MGLTIGRSAVSPRTTRCQPLLPRCRAVCLTCQRRKFRHPGGVLRRPAADYEPAESYESYEDSYDDAPRRGRRGGRKTTVVLGFFALAFLAVAVPRVFGI